jgi:putative transposase
LDYVHFNPVKHGRVTFARDWRYSTFHRLVKAGLYSADWGLATLRTSRPARRNA